ncbi:MAG: type IX secretion system membrane protein PorP/SprF [Bacteroidia bacterium]|nr:type IX secretion system membrane protein PorP/SprF [Bacteroidia bacterium]
MKKIMLMGLIFATGFAKSQQDAMFTHYMYNTLWLNPAYAGTRDALTITGIHRSQWVGFDGAPQDQTLTMHAPLFDGKMGLGLSVQNDKIGPTRSTFVAGDYSYQIKLNKKSKLGLGIKGMVNIFNNNISSLKLNTQQDGAFAQNYQTVTPNFGVGAYYYRERFYAGISTPKLLQNKLGSSKVSYNEQRHYYFIIGAVFNLSKTVQLKPTAFIKATESAPIEGDVTANFIFNQKLILGAMYRTGDAVGALLGYNITDAFTVGYSFDWSMANTTGKYNSGSHEIMLRYDLISLTKAKIKSPRYF